MTIKLDPTKTQVENAKIIGKSIYAVAYHAKKQGVKLAPAHPEFNPSVIDRSKTTVELAAIHHVGYKKMAKYLNKNSIEVRRAVNTTKFKYELWGDGNTQKENAVIFGVSQSTINGWIRRYKLKCVYKRRMKNDPHGAINKHKEPEEVFSSHRATIFTGGELGEGKERGFAYNEGEMV